MCESRIYEIKPILEPGNYIGPIKDANCNDCGILYSNFGIDFVFSSIDWDLIANKGSLLCANCICKRIARLKNVIRVRGIIDFIED